jgi:hypothetical protein
MKWLRALFSIYIYGSIHVALATVSLVLMTKHMFHNPFDPAMAVFVFCGTMFSYNFMKYESLFRFKRKIGRQVKIITALSAVAFAGGVVSFFYLGRVTQIAAVIFFGLTALYTVPFFPRRKNLRNLSGIKIYIVALCWAGVTLLLPLLNAGTEISADVFLKFGQRFLLVIILILIFEIIDLKEDDPHLKTIPQTIGVRNTKLLNLFLLIPFYFLEFFKSVIEAQQLLVNILLILIVAMFTIYANPDRPKYYTLFWVEAIPIFWLAMVVLAGQV